MAGENLLTKERAPSFAKLSKETGVSPVTLRKRWDRGDRGERLVRPTHPCERPALKAPRGIYI